MKKPLFLFFGLYVGACLPFAGMAQVLSNLERTVALMTKIGSCNSPTFSPDGQQVAFISNMNGSPQVWKVATGGGWPELLTAFDDPVSNVNWSPDGQWLSLTVAPGGGMNTQIYLIRPDGTGLRRLTDGGK